MVSVGGEALEICMSSCSKHSANLIQPMQLDDDCCDNNNCSGSRVITRAKSRQLEEKAASMFDMMRIRRNFHGDKSNQFIPLNKKIKITTRQMTANLAGKTKEEIIEELKVDCNVNGDYHQNNNYITYKTTTQQINKRSKLIHSSKQITVPVADQRIKTTSYSLEKLRLRSKLQSIRQHITDKMAPIANGCKDTDNNNNNNNNFNTNANDNDNEAKLIGGSVELNVHKEPVRGFRIGKKGACRKLSRLYNIKSSPATSSTFDDHQIIGIDHLIRAKSIQQCKSNAISETYVIESNNLDDIDNRDGLIYEYINKDKKSDDNNYTVNNGDNSVVGSSCGNNSSSVRQVRIRKCKQKVDENNGIGTRSLVNEHSNSSCGGRTSEAPSDIKTKSQQQQTPQRHQTKDTSEHIKHSPLDKSTRVDRITQKMSNHRDKSIKINHKGRNCAINNKMGKKTKKRPGQVGSKVTRLNKKIKNDDASSSSAGDTCNCNFKYEPNSKANNITENCDKTTTTKVMGQKESDVQANVDGGPPSPSQNPGNKNKTFRRQHKLISLGENKLNSSRQRTLCNKHMPWFGIDIGGTLVKVVFFDPKDATPDEEVTLKRIRRYLRSAKPYGTTGKRDSHLEMPNVIINKRAGSLHFIRFATSQMPDFLNMAKSKSFAATVNTVCATGGGAYKFEDIIRNDLGITLHKTDELDSIIIGIHYIDKFNSDRECYFLDNPLDDANCVKVPYNFSQPYPYLVVNIGSGVSILAVYSSNSYSRVSGSSIGGGTFLGLCSLLTQCKTYEEAIRLAKTGSSFKIDKLVKDIYGGDYPKFNLSGDTVASSFGHMNQADKRKEVKRNDLARALLEMITINIGSIARMCAASEEIDRVVFIGNFLRVNQLSMRLLSYAVNYWSKGAMKALFLEHEGYFGAVGCFVESTQGCLGLDLPAT